MAKAFLVAGRDMPGQTCDGLLYDVPLSAARKNEESGKMGGRRGGGGAGENGGEWGKMGGNGGKWGTWSSWRTLDGSLSFLVDVGWSFFSGL